MSKRSGATKKQRGGVTGKGFTPGKSGNPGGRKKGTSLRALLNAEIEKVCPGDNQGRTWKELIVIATMSLAMKGNATALKEVWERLDGKVTQPVSGDGPDGEIIFRFVGNSKVFES